MSPRIEWASPGDESDSKLMLGTSYRRPQITSICHRREMMIRKPEKAGGRQRTTIRVDDWGSTVRHREP